MSLQRAFERRQRYEAGLDNHPHPKVLEGLNEKVYEPKGLYLHARKGFRHFTEKRSRAGILTAEQKVGKFPPMIVALQAARMFIITGRWK